MMKKIMFSVLVFLFVCSCGTFAGRAWLFTNSSSGSWYRAPVTGGYMDLYLVIDYTTFTNFEFSVDYDSNVVNLLGAGSAFHTYPGISVVSANTISLSGSMRRTTFSVATDSGSAVTINDAPYQSDAVLGIRITPLAEATVVLGLWEETDTRYPASYKTCSLEIYNDGESVDYEPNVDNDEPTLAAFTDKTSATLFYYYDYHFGNPVSNGILRVTYNDSSYEDFSNSNPSKGITVDSNFGAFFITPQPDAVSYDILFPEYYDQNLSLTGGRNISHMTPENMMDIQNLFFHTVKAGTDDIVLNVWFPGIGASFEASEYDAAIAGENSGAVDKTFDFARIDDDRISVTIYGGLHKDYHYLYIFRNDVIQGYAFFDAAVYQNVTFLVKDTLDAPLSGIKVMFPYFDHMSGGMLNITEITDVHGMVSLDLPGSDWGNYYDYIVTDDDYTDVTGSLTVYASPAGEVIVLEPATGVNLGNFCHFASQWLQNWCDSWSNYCDGCDRNYDGNVDTEDLLKFIHLWLKDI